jgi:hypothetical protein
MRKTARVFAQARFSTQLANGLCKFVCPQKCSRRERPSNGAKMRPNETEITHGRVSWRTVLLTGGWAGRDRPLDYFLARLCRQIRSLGSGVFAIDALPQIFGLTPHSNEL